LTRAERLTVDDVFSDPIFDPPTVDGADRNALTYERIRHVQHHLATSEPLLTRPDRLRRILELAAVTDPCVFHVLFLHHCMATGAVLTFATEPTLPAEIGLPSDALGIALVTEVGHAGSSGNPLTEAEFDPERRDFILRSPTPAATKFPSAVGHDGTAKWAVVGARLRVAGVLHGMFLFVVPLRTAQGPCPGVRIRPVRTSPLLPVDSATTSFDGVRVPYRRWLSDGASIGDDGTLHEPQPTTQDRSRRTAGLPRLGWGGIGVGLAAAARAGAAIMLSYAGRRLTSAAPGPARPILSYSSVQRRLVDTVAEALAATALADRALPACWRLGPRPDADGGTSSDAPAIDDQVTTMLTKVAVHRLAERSLGRARVSCGGLGSFPASRLTDYLGLAMAFGSAGGDDEMMLLQAGGALAARDAAAADPLDAAWPAGHRTVSTLDLDTAADLLRIRLHQLQQAAGTAGAAPTTSRLLALAEAQVAWMTAQAMQAALADETDAELRSVRADLTTALVLALVTEHAGWYLAEGLLSGAAATGIDDLRDSLDRRVAEQADAVHLLLAVSTELTRSPLADDGYVAAFAG
jgi:acyl-CoA oxidase